MNLGLIGKKIGTTQIFSDDGKRIPVTVIQAGPCPIIQKKTASIDGYNAVQLGFVGCREKTINKPELGHLKKAGDKPLKILKEFRVQAKEWETLGEKKELSVVDLFKEGDFLDVTGTSKGRGFTGVMKRHNFSGAKATHGVHEFFRHGGSIGQHTYPGRVIKNKKMAGQHGNARVTIQNLSIVKVDKEKNLILVEGAIPGHKNGIVFIRKALKK